MRVSFVLDDFWSQILRCPAEAVGLLQSFLRQAEVCQLDVSVGIDQYVLWFEVSVDDPQLRVEMFQSEQYLRSVESGGLEPKLLLVLEVLEQFSSRHVVNTEVEVCVVLE